MSDVSVEEAGEYLNVKADGDLRVSISEDYDEVLVYENGIDNPVAKFSLSTGEQE